MSQLFSTNHIDSITLAQGIDVGLLVKQSQFKSPIELIQLTPYSEVVLCRFAKGVACVFEYGVVVLFGFNSHAKHALMDTLQSVLINPEPDPSWDLLYFEVSPERTEAFSLSHDVLTLKNTQDDMLLAIAHAIAQSDKLESFETQVNELINHHQHYAGELAESGRILLSRKALAKRRGHVFNKRHAIVAQFNLLDTPEHFWHHPKEQATYHSVCHYLELGPRTQLLSTKLTLVEQLFKLPLEVF